MYFHPPKRLNTLIFSTNFLFSFSLLGSETLPIPPLNPPFLSPISLNLSVFSPF